MFKAIQAYIKGRQTSPAANKEREELLQRVTEARRTLAHARAHYEALMASIVWTEGTDARIELAYNSVRHAEQVYGYLMSLARQEGITATWEEAVG